MDRKEALDRIANRLGLAPLNLKGANLKGADLSDAILTNANLTNANLTSANLTDANLVGADLAGANLMGANLRGANLMDANLTGADLTGANLTGAYLKGTNLTFANLLDANLTDAILLGANLTGTILASAIQMVLSSADLASANLAGEVDPFARLAQVLAGYKPLQGRNLQAWVEKWAAQFDKGVRQRVVEETAHVLENTLITQTAAEQILETLITDAEMCGDGDIRGWWKSSNFLWESRKGQSQRIMRDMIDKSLQDTHGLSITDCGSERGSKFQRYIYLDDVVCTGTQWKWAVDGWLKRESAKLAGDKEVHLWLVALAVHSHRLAHPIGHLEKVARDLGISLKIDVWAGFQMKSSDLLPIFEPTRYDDPSPQVLTLIEKLVQTGHPMKFREKNLTPPNCRVFSSEDARDLLEREFLTAGCWIKYELCTELKENLWPLGYDVLDGAGFGTPIVTWRNCPNNAPLALWSGDKWDPLLPRTANRTGLYVAGVTG